MLSIGVLLLAISLVWITPANVVYAQPQMYENFTNVTNGSRWLTVIPKCWNPDNGYIALGAAQTFIAVSNHSVTSVELCMTKTGTTGDVNVTINTIDSSGLPTETVLTSGSASSSSLVLDEYPHTVGTWLRVNLTSYKLTAGVKYAIVARSPNTYYDVVNDTNVVRWMTSVDGTSTNPSCFGTEVCSNTWYPYPDYHTLPFKVWGEAVSGPISNTENLKNNVTSLNLPAGLQSSKLSKLDAVIESLKLGLEKQAKNQLKAFINEVNAQRGKKLTNEQADWLLSIASGIFP